MSEFRRWQLALVSSLMIENGIMPLVRVSTQHKLSADLRAQMSDAIQEGIHRDLKAPHDDRFHIFADGSETLIYDKKYFGVDRSDATIFIQVFLKKGRTPEMKKSFYATVVSGLHSLGVRKEDIFISLSENDAADWSFGNGLAQLADKTS